MIFSSIQGSVIKLLVVATVVAGMFAYTMWQRAKIESLNSQLAAAKNNITQLTKANEELYNSYNQMVANMREIEEAADAAKESMSAALDEIRSLREHQRKSEERVSASLSDLAGSIENLPEPEQCPEMVRRGFGVIVRELYDGDESKNNENTR